MERVLVSACLLGQKVRYDGGDRLCEAETLQRWRAEGRLVPLCPEVAGGFPIPRPPAEIAGSLGGEAVLAGRASVIEHSGLDVTAGYLRGAAAALDQVERHGIRIAVLKDGSPSCGSAYTYDGTFSGRVVDRPGVTTAALRARGVHVFGEHQLAEAGALLECLESGAT